MYNSSVTAGCVKKGMKCSAGCHRKNCGNMQVASFPDSTTRMLGGGVWERG